MGNSNGHSNGHGRSDGHTLPCKAPYCAGKWLSTSTASIRGVTVGKGPEAGEGLGGKSEEEWELGFIEALFLQLDVSEEMKQEVEDTCRSQFGSPHGGCGLACKGGRACGGACNSLCSSPAPAFARCLSSSGSLALCVYVCVSLSLVVYRSGPISMSPAMVCL